MPNPWVSLRRDQHIPVNKAVSKKEQLEKGLEEEEEEKINQCAAASDLFDVHEAPDEGAIQVGGARLHPELHLAPVGLQDVRLEVADQRGQTGSGTVRRVDGYTCIQSESGSGFIKLHLQNISWI
jgi:hypothetical protein